MDRELDDKPARYGPRPPVARKIDPYRALIEARLAAYPKLTAMRLFEEIRQFSDDSFGLRAASEHQLKFRT